MTILARRHTWLFICLFVFELCILGCQAQNRSERLAPFAGTETSPKIYAGEKVIPEDEAWTFAVSVEKESGVCGGVLIQDEFVLTAGHCAYGSRISGIGFYRGDQKVAFRPVREVFVHPQITFDFTKYNEETWNDLAIVQFAGGLPSKAYKPISILNRKKPLRSGDAFQVIGPGRTSAEKDSRAFRKSFLTVTQVTPLGLGMAASDLTQRTGLCPGDSGSPGVIKKGDQMQLIGIASFIVLKNEIKCSPLNTVHFVLLEPYLNWIQITTGL